MASLIYERYDADTDDYNEAEDYADNDDDGGDNNGNDDLSFFFFFFS